MPAYRTSLFTGKCSTYAYLLSDRGSFGPCSATRSRYPVAPPIHIACMHICRAAAPLNTLMIF